MKGTGCDWDQKLHTLYPVCCLQAPREWPIGYVTEEAGPGPTWFLMGFGRWWQWVAWFSCDLGAADSRV